ncbi:putative phosphoenolpyruvate synthase [Nymphon striatum]|nr:putative phosphoenolpyruvate synthase [Nymphon striatum]KAG1649820.1 putative phosphoenolpyruvate synthase [Nymphon striatum]KAG1649822.1 putative phosphoenolpyruvate synthase [Nymphon striatum]
METFLGCKGINQIFETVKKCWASLFGFKAIEYRRQNGQAINIGMCVVVQEMVAAEAAGVMFTRDPRTGSPQTMSIASNHGLGESVVSAAADPDDITVGRAHDGTLTVKNIVMGKKATKVLMNQSEGIETVANELADKQCSITNEQILILAQIGVYVEKKYGDARDIEWAMSNGKPYLLQSRPITSLYQMTDSEYINEYNTPLLSDTDRISSGNVKEVLPGALSPLWNTYFDELFLIALALLLTVHRDMKYMKNKFENLDLDYEYYTDMEELSDKLIMESEPFVNAFEIHVRITLASMFMNSLVLVELLGSSTDISDEKYEDFANLMAVDSSAEMVESANIPKLADAIRKATGKEKFTSMSKEEAVKWLTSNNSPVKNDYDEFIFRHGHRCIKEFDPISKPWCMDPSKLIAPLCATLNNDNVKYKKKLTIDEALKNLKTPLTSKQKKKLRDTVLKARQFVAYREQAKVELNQLLHKFYSESGVDSTLINFTLPGGVESTPVVELIQLLENNSTPVSRGIVEATARVVQDVEDAGCIKNGDILVTTSTDIAWSPYFSILVRSNYRNWRLGFTCFTEIRFSMGYFGTKNPGGAIYSSGAVVAREYGIPCVVGVTGATDSLKSGDMIRLNGNTGAIERLDS